MKHLSTALAALPLTAATALAAPQGMVAGPMLESIGTVREDARVFLSYAIGDASEWVTHPKDAGLARAFGMLPSRLADLPMEFGQEMPRELLIAFDPEVMPIWLRMLQAPKSLSLGASTQQRAETGNAMTMGFAMHEADEEAAARFHGQLMGLLEGMGAPLPEGFITVDGRSLVLRAGAAPPALGSSKAASMLEGFAIAEEVSIDVGAFVSYTQDLFQAGFAPSDARMVLGILRQLGLENLQLDIAAGMNGTRSRTVSVATGLGKSMRASGILPEGGITAAHLAPVPADATFAVVERIDMRAGFEALNGFVSAMLAQQGMGPDVDLGDMVKSTTGIDVREDLFGALGQTLGFYASDTTGGGGMTSMVMFMEVADEDSLVDTKETVEELVNALAMGPARGYVSIRAWEDDEVEYTTLMFPGLPVPLELTMAMGQGWIVMGSTPTAARGAMQHIRSGAPGLATRPEVAKVLGAEGRTAISFFDTAYYARIGYGPTSLMMSAVSNAVRSPIDATREPGPVMPTFNEFREGILPAVGYTEVRGDDIVSITEGDGSMVVGLAAVAGLVQEYAVLFALPLAALGAEEIGREFGFRF